MALNIHNALQNIQLLQIENKNLWDARIFELNEFDSKINKKILDEVSAVLDGNTTLVQAIRETQKANDYLAKLSFTLGIIALAIGVAPYIEKLVCWLKSIISS
jgi:hypothetical protein